jgi:flagellar basal-body rod modification protein FlgD
MSSVNPLVQTPVMPGSQAEGTGPSLGKDDFLKVLVGQMQHMDPMNTEGGSQEFMAQMTQFSMLEQMQNLAAASERSSTFALIGRTVTWKAADGSTQEGAVESVQAAGSKLTLTVAGQAGVDPATVTTVR